MDAVLGTTVLGGQSCPVVILAPEVEDDWCHSLRLSQINNFPPEATFHVSFTAEYSQEPRSGVSFLLLCV